MMAWSENKKAAAGLDLPTTAFDKSLFLELRRSQADYLAKASGIGNGQLRENFTVQFNIGFLQPMNQAAVGQVVHSGAGIDAGDPEFPEISFFGPAVTVGVHQGLVHGIGGRPKQLAAPAAVTLGQFKHLFSSLSCFESSFYTHFNSPSVLCTCGRRLPDAANPFNRSATAV
jgi:hypothetical protein